MLVCKGGFHPSVDPAQPTDPAVKRTQRKTIKLVDEAAEGSTQPSQPLTVPGRAGTVLGPGRPACRIQLDMLARGGVEREGVQELCSRFFRLGQKRCYVFGLSPLVSLGCPSQCLPAITSAAVGVSPPDAHITLTDAASSPQDATAVIFDSIGRSEPSGGPPCPSRKTSRPTGRPRPLMRHLVGDLTIHPISVSSTCRWWRSLRTGPTLLIGIV